MDQLAADITNSAESARADRWVGVYKAQNIRKLPGGGVQFTVEDRNGASYSSGFIYLPKSDPARARWRTRRYVGGAWWTWWEEK